MTLEDAFYKEIAREKKDVYAAKPSRCHVCGKDNEECRAGTCFNCAQKVETDMVEVWEIQNPQNRWPYKWIETEPKSVKISVEDYKRMSPADRDKVVRDMAEGKLDIQ